MFLSVFDLFKIGVGPSSSHTMGPMVAASRFLNDLETFRGRTKRVSVSLYGSLAFTGKGHSTDVAVILGLAGQEPDTLNSSETKNIVDRVRRERSLAASGFDAVAFDPETDIVFDYGPALARHSNGMIFRVWDDSGSNFQSWTYYSIGGGFVLSEGEIAGNLMRVRVAREVPFPFSSAQEMLEMGASSNLSIAAMKYANELVSNDIGDLDTRLDRIWHVMNACIERGLSTDGTLPGDLKVKRRARKLYMDLRSEERANASDPHRALEWLGVFAMAVNEENAAGGQIVTAPTNGAAGVIPAVVRHYLESCSGASQRGVREFLLVAAAIGGIIKHSASISGAEVGCQGEVGSASAMAAAGLAAALGGTNAQIENAAEIALEHHLGMTCDPIGGLVQIPCIERNAFGAVKAVTAASLALRGNGLHVVPLDSCIKTMRETGLDMNAKYKETSTGGLAVNVVEC